MKTFIFLFSILLASFSWVHAGGKSHKEKIGDKHYAVYAFDKAITNYLDARSLSAEGQRRLAKSYRNLNMNGHAEDAYAKLIADQREIVPEDYYAYAMVLKSNGKQMHSNESMDKFALLRPEDLRSKDFISNRSNHASLHTDDHKYEIVSMQINTAAQDMGTSYYQKQIVFTSSRSTKMNPRKYNWNGLPFLNMYVSDIDKDQLKAPVVFNKDFNGKMHDGPASFNKAGTYMAYTMNSSKTHKRERFVGLQIFFRNYQDGQWTDPIPFPLNNLQYSVGHPSLSADGRSMYFASDMPGGFGRADIYIIRKSESGEWGTPVNLGPKINTEGDELFPFYEEKNEVLFFASDGRYGLGGLDVFLCSMSKTHTGSVINAGHPLNGKSDDFAVIVDDNLKIGYFSSNREGGKGSDDIYSFTALKGIDMGNKIMGTAMDKSGNPIPGTSISLFGSTGILLETQTTGESGSFTFLVSQNQEYKIKGKKEGFEDGSTSTSTFGSDYIVYANVTLLNAAELLVEEIREGADLGKILKFNPIYFDLDKYNVKAEAETELNKIVKAMNQHPNMVVELRAYADCRASVAYNQALSDKRAKSSVDYIKKRITKPSRITGKGFSESKLVNDCACDDNTLSGCSELQHQLNRRTEFIIIKK